MEVKEYKELEILFWKWCKTFKHYNDFANEQRTLKQILDLIERDAYLANEQMIPCEDKQ